MFTRARFYLRLTELAVTALLTLAMAAAWRADRQDRAHLAVELATAKHALAQADARQHDRDTQLLQTLATLAAEKRTVTAPAAIVRDLPQQIPLPAPIVLQPASPPNPNQPGAAASQTQAVIPTADLKPLYDFALDCKACQAKLATAQSDLADEHAKTATLTKERDTALRVAKGGSALQRIARAAKWLAIGIALGAVAARAAH
jgi:hypothetical protein